MADEGKSVFGAFFRLFTFWKWRWVRRLIRIGDEQFTGSVDGIRDAFDIQRDRLISQYQGFRDAVAQVEVVVEEKRQRLADLNDEEEKLLQMRDGALAAAEKAKEANNQDDYTKHEAAFARFQARIEEIEALQGRLETEIGELGQSMKKHLFGLTKLQAEIKKLPADKAQAIADHVSSTKIIELNDRLQGLQTSMDRGPIDAVLQANKELTAKARISEKLAGTDVNLQNDEYLREGRSSTASDKLSQMLAARAAERKAKTEGVSATQVSERPQI